MKKVVSAGFLFFLILSIYGQDENNFCLRDQDFHIVVLGSSTAEGQGPDDIQNAWVNRYLRFVQDINPNNQVTNLAIGGTTTYHILPDWFPQQPNRPVVNPNNNISRAIALGADAIIVNMPSNDAANGFSAQEQINNFQTIATEAFDAGLQFWFCTTQPRTPFGETENEVQLEVRDFILNFFGPFGIDFWTDFADENNDIKPIFDSGDGTHINDEAHEILFERVKDKNILSNLLDLPEGFDIALVDAEIILREGCGSKGFDFIITYVNQGSALFNLQSIVTHIIELNGCLLYTSPSPRDATLSRMPSSA